VAESEFVVPRITRQNFAKASVAALRNGIVNGRFNTLPAIPHPPWQQRVAAITDGLLADLGGADQVSFQERILIERVSVQILQLELCETQWGERNDGRATDLQQLVYQRGLNSVRRVFETLSHGLQRRPRDVTATPSLEQYLRNKQARQEPDDVEAEAE
jgi:hypothetical protein